MSRFFSSSARAFIKFIGYDKENLPSSFKQSLENALKSGGKAEQVVGKVQQVNIKSRDGNPIHQSHFNRADKAEVISVRILGSQGSKTFHIYEDGLATSSKDDR